MGVRAESQGQPHDFRLTIYLYRSPPEDLSGDQDRSTLGMNFVLSVMLFVGKSNRWPTSIFSPKILAFQTIGDFFKELRREKKIHHFLGKFQSLKNPRSTISWLSFRSSFRPSFRPSCNGSLKPHHYSSHWNRIKYLYNQRSTWRPWYAYHKC